MTSMADDINEQINAGRKTIAIATEDPGEDDMEPRRVPPAVVAAGIGAAIVGLGLLGWLIYRSRRRRTIVQQLRMALPGRVGDLREMGAGLPGRMSGLRERSAERIGDLREIGLERMGDVRSLRDEVRKRLRKAL